MFTGRRVLAEPAGKTGEPAHVPSHELARQHAGVDGLRVRKRTSPQRQSASCGLRGRLTWVGSSDQFCPERIRRSTRSPSQMESAALLSSIRWDFMFPLRGDAALKGETVQATCRWRRVLPTRRPLDARSGSFLGQRAARASSRGRRGRTCPGGSCGRFPRQRQRLSCRRRRGPFSCLCGLWQRRTCTGRTASPCPWPTTCSGCASPEDSTTTVVNEDASAAARSPPFPFYLSHILIGGQDDFLKSRRPDVDSLLESDGHHGCLIKETKVKREALPAHQLIMHAGPVHVPLSVPLVVSGSADQSNSWPASGSSCGCDRCTCR